MGCDIHGWVEWKPDDPAYGGRWVGVGQLTKYGNERNYKRFAALAGVRGEGPEANGAPDDMSDSTRFDMMENWAGDAHSSCWFPLSVACMLWSGTEGAYPRTGTDAEMVTRYHDNPEYLYFGIENVMQSMSHYRVVCWFDN